MDREGEKQTEKEREKERERKREREGERGREIKRGNSKRDNGLTLHPLTYLENARPPRTRSA